MTVCGKTNEELISEIASLKFQLDYAREALGRKADECNSWVELYNAMRTVALRLTWRLGESINIDEAAIAVRDKTRIENILRKPT